MCFVAGVEEFTFAVGRDGEYLTFVTSSDIEGSVGRKGQVPDVFCFGIEENGLLAGSRDSINLAVGGSADVERAFGVKGDGLCGEVRGIEDHGRLAVRIEAKYFRRRAARSVKRALGIEADGPKIGGIRIGQQSEFRRELKSAIAAHGHAMRGAFEEFFVSGLAPAASVLGEGRGEAKEVEEVNEVKDSEQACSGRRLGHCGFHRICRFREM